MSTHILSKLSEHLSLILQKAASSISKTWTEYSPNILGITNLSAQVIRNKAHEHTICFAFF